MLALTASICYGIMSPTMKIAMQNGATPNAMLLVYGIGALITSLIWWKSGVGLITTSISGVGIITMAVVAVCTGIAFVSITTAFALPNSSVTVVMSIVATYPVLSAAIEIIFMDAKLNPVQAFVGCVLVVVGGVLVATSTHA